jgi:hypothetical protein
MSRAPGKYVAGTMALAGAALDRPGLDSSRPAEGPVEGSCEHGNEPSGFIKCWEILE